MPTYNYSCVPCTLTAEHVMVPFIERDRMSCACGVKMERLVSFPYIGGDLGTYVDYGDPSGTFPKRSGGWREHRELVAKRKDMGLSWVPGR